MKLHAFAKINLGLDVNPKSFSFTNKHQIHSLFILWTALFDEIEIQESSKDQIIYYEANTHNVIEYENCLLAKTLDYLKQKGIKNKSYLIKVYKNIPSGAGLGGGSSDAATIMNYIHRNESSNITLDLLDIALNLGSDIPFFLKSVKAAIVDGFGEIIQPINWVCKDYIQVHLFRQSIKTKDIFENYLNNNKIKQVELNNYDQFINAGNTFDKWFKLHNDLETSVFQLYPQVYNFYCQLKQHHDFVIMSGSGSTMVSIDKTAKKVRTRYAPSPTGYFHIGGARTAIFNYLYAKHMGGDFIVRIEDTDTERNVEGGIESQLNNLAWMGIIPDESINNPGAFGPYIQSAKLQRYQELAHKLLKEGKAYYCFCSEDQLEKDREEALANHQTPRYSRRCLHLTEEQVQEKLSQNIPCVIRLKIDDNRNYEWDDLIRGQISVPGTAMTDPVILKSNGIAMYNFAVVVDDYDMQITHVLRGEEHISNTPYQLAIKEALGFESDIRYGHLSVIIDETGKKLSKRNKSLKQFVEDYKQMGFIPEAVVNFLALLGWSPASNKEVMSLDEIIAEFDIKNLSHSSTFFDFKKLLWIANEYFKKMSNEEYLNFVKPFIKVDLDDFKKAHLDQLLLLFKNQISYATEINDLINEFFGEKTLNLNDEMLEILTNNKDVVECFSKLLEQSTNFDEDTLKQLINETKAQTGKKGKDLFMPIRILTTGMMHGPELAKIIYLSGKPTVVNQIQQVIATMK